jgi:hypothetical protein
MLFGETVAVYCENHMEHTDTVRTSRETHYVSATEPNRLMLFWKTFAVYCENHTEHTNTFRRQSSEFYMLREVVYIVTTGRYRIKLRVIRSPCCIHSE